MRKIVKAIAPLLFLIAVFLSMLNVRIQDTLNEKERDIIEYYRQEITEVK